MGPATRLPVGTPAFRAAVPRLSPLRYQGIPFMWEEASTRPREGGVVYNRAGTWLRFWTRLPTELSRLGTPFLMERLMTCYSQAITYIWPGGLARLVMRCRYPL